MADLSKDSDALQTVNAEIDEIKSAYTKRHANNIRLYRLYRSKPDEKKEKWKSNVFISLIFSTVNTIVPRVVKALIGDGTNFFTIKPSKNNKKADAEKKATAITELVYLYLRDLCFYVKLAGAFLYALIFGNAYLKIFWTCIEEEVEEYEDIKDEKTGEVKREVKKIKKKVVDRPEIEIVNPQDLFIPTDAIDLQSSPYVIYRTYKNLDSLKANPVYAKYKSQFSSIGEDLKNSTAEELRLEIGDTFTANKKVEVFERWSNKRVIVIANGKLIRNDKNPFKHGKKPFVGIINYAEPNTVNGVSEIEPIETIQYWINDCTNIRIDNMKSVLNQMWSVIKGSLINPLQLRSRPGGIVEVMSHEEIQAIPTPEIKGSAYEEVNQMRNYMQIITGVTDYTSGGSTDTKLNDTATGIMAIIKEANERFAFKIRMWRVSVIQEVLKMVVELIQQFTTGEDVKRILGDHVPDFEPEDEDIQVDYEYEISGILSDEEKIRELTATTQFVAMGSKLQTQKKEIDNDKVLVKFSSLLNLQDLVVDKQPIRDPKPGGMVTATPSTKNMTPGASATGLPTSSTPGEGNPAMPFNRDQIIFIAKKTGRSPRDIIKELVQGKSPKDLVAEVTNIVAGQQSQIGQQSQTLPQKQTQGGLI